MSSARPAWATASHLLENPLSLLLAQRLNIPPPEKLLHFLTGVLSIRIGELSAAALATSFATRAGSATRTASELPLAGGASTLPSSAESTAAGGASRTTTLAATATHLLKQLPPLFFTQRLHIPAAQKLLHALAHLLATFTGRLTAASTTRATWATLLPAAAPLPARFTALRRPTRVAWARSAEATRTGAARAASSAWCAAAKAAEGTPSRAAAGATSSTRPSSRESGSARCVSRASTASS